MKLAVPMFHALYGDEKQHQALRADERPYAISELAFEQVLDELVELDPVWVNDPLQLAAAQTGRLAIMLTFDDGHASAVNNALPILQRRGIPAVFFVTTDFISQRDDYCDEQQLMALCEAGMSVQSHGQSHRFLNTLSRQQSAAEMANSKAMLEAITGRSVNAISFPGGRFGRREIELGRVAGYREFHTSQFGRNAVDGSNQQQFRRIAYRAGTTATSFTGLIAGRPWVSTKHRAIHAIKRTVRMLLGEQGYQKAYERLKAR